jgi:uncharacterized protein
MGALRQRLNWSDDGALHDGPRRYLMMRTDVLMGTLLHLPAAAQADLLRAWAASTREHGAASLQAYAQQSGGDAKALTEATVQAAADLGWGRWAVTPIADGLQLQVHGSPFVHGWRAVAAGGGTAAAGPVCAPIAGMFGALAGLLLQGPVAVVESCCVATPAHAHEACAFVARRTTSHTPPITTAAKAP